MRKCRERHPANPPPPTKPQEEFSRKRKELEAVPASAARGSKAKRRKKNAAKSDLSFDMDGEEGETESAAAAGSGSSDPAAVTADADTAKAKSGEADTAAVMPVYGTEKARRDKEEAALRRQAEAAFEQKKAAEMAEEISVAYNVHPDRRKYVAVVTKGTTVGQFVQACLRENPALKTVNEAMFVKEDLILPNDSHFYDFFVAESKGRSGRLCEFGTILDEGGRKKTTAVVCTKWYAANRENVPVVNWQHFDFAQDYTKSWRSGQTGDWNCAACGVLNWGSKNPLKCGRCSAERPKFNLPLV